MTSQIDIAQELKSLSKKLIGLESECKSIVPKVAEDFVRHAELDAAIDAVKQQRVELGKQLLKLDQDAVKRKAERADQAAVDRDEKLDAFLARLADYTAKLKTLPALGEEFDALVAESKELERLNTIAVSTGKGRPIGVVFPSKLRTRLRSALLSAFGMEVLANINPVRNALSKGSYDVVADTAEAIKAVLS